MSKDVKKEVLSREEIKPISSVPIRALMSNANALAAGITNDNEKRIYLDTMQYITKSALLRRPLTFTPAEVLPTVLLHMGKGETLCKALSEIPMSRRNFDVMRGEYFEMQLGYDLARQLFAAYWEGEQAKALRNRDAGFNFYSFYSRMQRAVGAKNGYAAPNDTIVKIPGLAKATTAEGRYNAVLDYIATHGIGVKALTQLTAAMASLTQMRDVDDLAKEVGQLKSRVEGLD